MLIHTQPGELVSSVSDGVQEVRGERFSSSWGTRIWLMQWLEHHGRLLGSTKINGDLTARWQAAWAFIPWTAALGWWFLYSGHCLGAGMMPTHRRTVPNHRVRGDQRLQDKCWSPMGIRKHTQILLFPPQMLTPTSFPLSSPASRCHCFSFGHPPRKGTNSSLFWANVDMASFLRVATLWVWIQSYKNGIPMSSCYFFLLLF